MRYVEHLQDKQHLEDEGDWLLLLLSNLSAVIEGLFSTAPGSYL